MVSVVAVGVLAALAVVVTGEAMDRRGRAPCPGPSPAPVVETVEERTWWPIGQRCTARHADGTTHTSSTSWTVTVLVLSFVAVLAVGAVAPGASVRRRLAGGIALLVVPLVVLVVATVRPSRPTQLVGLVTISLGLTAIPGAVTGLGAWYLLRGRRGRTVLLSWLAWAVVVFWMGKDGIGD